MNLPFTSMPFPGLFKIGFRSWAVGFSLISTGLVGLAAESNTPAIVPVPQKMERREGSFAFNTDTCIYVDSSSRKTGEYLAERLRQATGYPFKVKVLSSSPAPKGVTLLTSKDTGAEPGAEGYKLIVAPDSIVIDGPDQAGVFYGVQSLLQLLPSEIFSDRAVTNVQWRVPAVQIEDQPRFKWRGMLLDVSRHFYSKQEVKRLLDMMALHKLNTFHWHLVDDPGWRIEIKKYPRLTQVGAWRSGVDFGLDPKSSDAYGADGRYGGFYTQKDIREVVAYAQARHISVIPEIEMPGHSIAALAAYPQLGCFDGPYSTDIGPGVHHGVYCSANEQSFEFLQDVLSEVFELFPGKYIHIGGDEVPKDNWKKCPKCQARMKSEGLKNEEELQSYFIRRMEKFVNAKGRTIIGWSEILQGGLAQNAVVMDWIGGGLHAASSGHDVVMTPLGDCYFDHYQSADLPQEPRAIGGYLPMRKVYSFEPIPAGLSAQNYSHVLGAQANLWTEYIASEQHLEYMIFPRLCALAEVLWSAKEQRNWDDFQQRLSMHEARLDILGIAYCKDRSVNLGEWSPSDFSSQEIALQWDVTSHLKAQGEYRVSLDYTRGNHGLGISAVALLENGNEIARSTHSGFTGVEPRTPVYVLTLPEPKAGAHYILKAFVKPDGGTDSYGQVSWNFVPHKY